MAFASPHVTAIAVEATEFPDLARKYHVSGVPKTVVNDQVEIMGALPEQPFIEQALSAIETTAFHEDTENTKDTK
jgi:predicted DsbA family dithiol-disulfide isomerase